MDDSFIPILLTWEILEKNGFKQNKQDEYVKRVQRWDGYIEIYIMPGNHIINIAEVDCSPEGIEECSWGNEIYIPNREGECIYVHDLQHVFRLCGLNELADNFIV